MINDIQFTYICGYLSGIITWIIITAAAVWLGRKGERPYYRKPKDQDEDISYACPRCGGTVGIYDMEDNYCSDCGQKIDWRKRNG